jgi:hypothetical protein
VVFSVLVRRMLAGNAWCFIFGGWGSEGQRVACRIYGAASTADGASSLNNNQRTSAMLQDLLDELGRQGLLRTLATDFLFLSTGQR